MSRRLKQDRARLRRGLFASGRGDGGSADAAGEAQVLRGAASDAGTASGRPRRRSPCRAATTGGSRSAGGTASCSRRRCCRRSRARLRRCTCAPLTAQRREGREMRVVELVSRAVGSQSRLPPTCSSRRRRRVPWRRRGSARRAARRCRRRGASRCRRGAPKVSCTRPGRRRGRRTGRPSAPERR